MKYFTPELYLRLQDFSSDEVMDAAETAWEQAAQKYQRRLRRIQERLPAGLRGLQQNHYLHDADLLSIGRQGQTFVFVLRLDTPPRQLLVLNYTLRKPAVIHSSALPGRNAPGPVQWMYDEVDLVRGEDLGFRHSILFSNGWEVALTASDVTTLGAEVVYPPPETMLAPVVTKKLASKSA